MRCTRRDIAAELVLAKAIDFLTLGWTSSLRHTTARQAKTGIVALQTAVELMAKYRLVRERGSEVIVRGTPPSGDLLTAALRGSMRTIGYGECLMAIRETENFTPIEEELVGHAQQLRNSLVDFAADADVDEVRMRLARLLIRALGMFVTCEQDSTCERELN